MRTHIFRLRRPHPERARPPGSYWARFTVALVVVCAGITMMVISAVSCGAPRSGWRSDAAFLIAWSVVLAGDHAAPRRAAL